MERHKCRPKRKTMNSREWHNPNGKPSTQRKTINSKEYINPKERHRSRRKTWTQRKKHNDIFLEHRRYRAALHIWISFPLTTCEVRDVPMPSIELNFCLPCCIRGCCNLCLSFYKQLRVFIYCLLEDGYGIVPHLTFVVCQNVCLIVQHCLAVRVEAEQF